MLFLKTYEAYTDDIIEEIISLPDFKEILKHCDLISTDRQLKNYTFMFRSKKSFKKYDYIDYQYEYAVFKTGYIRVKTTLDDRWMVYMYIDQPTTIQMFKNLIHSLKLKIQKDLKIQSSENDENVSLEKLIEIKDLLINQLKKLLKVNVVNSFKISEKLKRIKLEMFKETDAHLHVSIILKDKCSINIILENHRKSDNYKNSYTETIYPYNKSENILEYVNYILIKILNNISLLSHVMDLGPDPGKPNVLELKQPIMPQNIKTTLIYDIVKNFKNNMINYLDDKMYHVPKNDDVEGWFE